MNTSEDKIFDFLTDFAKYSMENSGAAKQCHQILANFLRAASSYIKAHWFPIASEGYNSLVVLLRLVYQQRYLPLMITYGLVKISRSKIRSMLSISHSSVYY